LLRSLQTTSQANFRIETINAAESFPKSTALEANIRRGLERGSGSNVHYVHPWNVDETLAELQRRKYFPQSSKQGNDMNISRWPQVLRAAVEGGANLAISSLGATLYYLQRNVIDREILSMGIVKAYIPPESCNATDHQQLEDIVQLAQETNSNEAGIITPSVLSQATTSMSSAFARDGESPASKENETTFMSLDGTTLHNLEILTNAVDHKVAGSLWSKLNFTKTPHGSRLLRAWLLRPLFKKADIDRRLDAVTELVSGGAAVALEEVRSVLSKCGDIERLLSRVHTMGIGAGANDDEMDHIHPNDRAVMYEAVTYTKRKVGDFSKLLNSLKQASRIPEIFQGIEIHSGLLMKVVRLFDHGGSFPDMVEDLDWFFANFDCDLAVKGQFEPSRGIDELFDVATDEIERIKEEFMRYKEEMCETHLQPRSQAKAEWKYANTNSDSKDKYMIELPATIKVPDAFLWKGKRGSGKKQVNKYRSQFIDNLVQELEKAYEVRNERQAKGMQLIFAEFDSKRDIWAAAAQATALLDALGSLARTASKPGFVRPTILDCPPDASPTIRIVKGRHPCVENSMGSEFIPNDLFLGSSDEKAPLPRVLLLSGPNMGVSYFCSLTFVLFFICKFHIECVLLCFVFTYRGKVLYFVKLV
jgi:DNA mismatch repair protein MSH6